MTEGTFQEQFLAFDCAGESCAGILAMPKAEHEQTGVVIVVGGPQYRVGSHRQFTLLARALATQGIPTLRFDYRGMGDSSGDMRPFDTIDADLAAAVETLKRNTDCTHVVLWGLCDGASASLMYAWQDASIAGIVAVNPWARSPRIEASTRLRHYYVKRLFSADLWRRVLTGKVSIRQRASDLRRDVAASAGSCNTADADYLDRMDKGWRSFSRPVLLLLSGRDFTAREFESWVAQRPERNAVLRSPRTRVCPILDADHTFSTQALRDLVARETTQWIASLGAGCR